MKVKELKELLESFDENMLVTIEGASSLMGFAIYDVKESQEKLWNKDSHNYELTNVVHLISYGVQTLQENAIGAGL